MSGATCCNVFCSHGHCVINASCAILDRRLADEQEASAVLRREPSGQRTPRRVEIGKIGDAPRRAAGLAETHQPDEYGREELALARVETMGADALGLVRQGAGDAADLRISNEQAGAVGLVLLPHGVERHLNQREITGAITDVAPDQSDHRVLFGKVRMAGESERLADRVGNSRVRDPPKPQHGILIVARQMLEQVRQRPAEVEMVGAQREHDPEPAGGGQRHEKIDERRTRGFHGLGQQLLELIDNQQCFRLADPQIATDRIRGSRSGPRGRRACAARCIRPPSDRAAQPPRSRPASNPRSGRVRGA